jgi:hypothetical protein
MIDAGLRNEVKSEGRSALSSADAAGLDHGQCGGICALCPNSERHAAVRTAFAIDEGEHIPGKH